MCHLTSYLEESNQKYLFFYYLATYFLNLLTAIQYETYVIQAGCIVLSHGVESVPGYVKFGSRNYFPLPPPHSLQTLFVRSLPNKTPNLPSYEALHVKFPFRNEALSIGT